MITEEGRQIKRKQQRICSVLSEDINQQVRRASETSVRSVLFAHERLLYFVFQRVLIVEISCGEIETDKMVIHRRHIMVLITVDRH